MITIDDDFLDQLNAKAKASPRLRTSYNFHKDAGDSIHRMLNAMEPGTYIQPHKHENPDKREAFWVLRGKIALTTFRDNGTIINSKVLGPGTGNHGIELPPGTWHNLICIEKNSVAYEVKDGPWDPENDKIFAPWAPGENDNEAEKYMEDLINRLKLNK